MPIVSGHPDQKGNLITPLSTATPAVEVTQIKTTSPTVDLPTVDLKLAPMPSLMSHISGAPWGINSYYSQVLTKDSEIAGLQATSSAPYQSYSKIQNLVIYVSTPLASIQDDTTKAMKVSGTAMLLPFVIPNEGDMFTADIDQGRIALFRITQTTKKSIFKESVYEISYDLDTTDAAKITALETRSIRTLYYRSDYLTVGKNPIITSSDFDALASLSAVFPKMAKHYMKLFFSKEYSTLMVPHQSIKVCDYFLLRFIAQLLTHADATEMVFLRMPNVTEAEVMSSMTLWDALLYRDPELLNQCWKRAGLMSVNYFQKDPLLMSIAYSGIDRVVWPYDPLTTTDSSNGISMATQMASGYTPSFPTGVPVNANAFIYTENLRGVTAADAIPAVTADDYYVLTQNFWLKLPGQTQFESTVWSYLTHGNVDAQQLLDLSKLYHQWGILEQFYYMPIVMLLIKSKLAGL